MVWKSLFGRTKAVNSWGLDISDATKVFGGELIGVEFFESATFGSLDGVEAGVKFSGSGILDPGRDPCEEFWQQRPPHLSNRFLFIVTLRVGMRLRVVHYSWELFQPPSISLHWTGNLQYPKLGEASYFWCPSRFISETWASF